MRWLRGLALVAVLAAACDRSSTVPIALPTSAPQAAATTPTPEPSTTKVVRVVDGDTVVITGIDVGEIDRRTGGRKARLIGIDTPEVFGGAECLGGEASRFTHDELDGQEIVVRFDVDTVDRYGRALVYIWSGDTFFNERIVAQGFALPMTVPPNVRYAEVFVGAAREARANGRGLWSRC